MTVVQIGVLAALAALTGRLRRGRQLAMLAVSVLAIFWLQPAEPVGSLRYWLALATLAVVVASWAATASPETRSLAGNWQALLLIGGVAVLADLNRYARLQGLFALQAPPPAVALAAILALAAAVAALLRWPGWGRPARWLLLAGMLGAFVVLKTPGVPERWLASLAALRGVATEGQAVPLTWLGYSYLAFRLIHTIRDRQAGRLPPVTLQEYINYAIFFPAFTAGPIDRVERFVKDLCAPAPTTNEDWIEGGTRLFAGLFKKFVVADLLAVISINKVLVEQSHSSLLLWVFLYAYAFRIYLDFSGYTDIAIGMGRLAGIRLPENFAAPYLRPNLTQFWNAWHMSLTQWFRAYFFNPLTRWLRSRPRPMPTWLVLALVQLSTMALIGLWHGITWGFLAWGLWHGVGLFIHNRWSEFSRGRMPAWSETPSGGRIVRGLGVLLTFHFVALGWLFFTLPAPATALAAMQKLFGLA